MLNGVCNADTLQWEAVGIVHPPEEPICGTRPDNLSENAVCDAATAEWQELIVVGTGSEAGCIGEPPVNMGLAVCNLETGFWEDDYVALDSATYEDVMENTEEPIIDIDPVSGELVINTPEAEPVIEIDPLTGELTIEEPEPETVIEVDPLTGELTVEEVEPVNDAVQEALEEAARNNSADVAQPQENNQV